MAIECGKKFKKGSRMFLVARNIEGLNATKDQILEFNPDLDILTFQLDLSSPSEHQLRDMFKNALGTNVVSDFDQAFIVHNVGTLGDTRKKAKDCYNVIEWQEHFNCNVFSVILLNNIFLEIFKTIKKYVVNITSKAAVFPFSGFAFYGPNKAAREIFFRNLAEEEREDKSLVILNYAPGPVNTDMLNCVAETTVFPAFRDFIQEGKKTGAVLTTAQTTARLISLLEKGNYESGARIDYFDD